MTDTPQPDGDIIRELSQALGGAEPKEHSPRQSLNEENQLLILGAMKQIDELVMALLPLIEGKCSAGIEIEINDRSILISKLETLESKLRELNKKREEKGPQYCNCIVSMIEDDIRSLERKINSLNLAKKTIRTSQNRIDLHLGRIEAYRKLIKEITGIDLPITLPADI